MNYRSVFLAITILIGEKLFTCCLIARHLDEKSHDCKQRIAVLENVRPHRCQEIFNKISSQEVFLHPTFPTCVIL